MIIELGFSSPPDTSVVTQTQSLVHSSSLAKLATVYVTGEPALAVDFANTAMPALDDSILPGLAISLLVAGLLFLSPVAALVPILIGGFAIGISLGSVYGLVVVVQKSADQLRSPISDDSHDAGSCGGLLRAPTQKDEGRASQRQVSRR